MSKNRGMVAADLFADFVKGEQLAEIGMQQAVDHAEEVFENWGDEALAFVRKYVSYTKDPFMAEDVRMASLQVVPEPPTKRAWGLIMRRAAQANLISRVGYRKVTNRRAHGTPAALWVRV